MSECWAFEPVFKATVHQLKEHAWLSMQVGMYGDKVDLTLNLRQLRQIRDAIDAFLTMEEAAPAATGAANGWTPPF